MLTRKEFADEIERLAAHLQNTSITILSQANVAATPGFVCSFIKYQATQAVRIVEWLRQDGVDDTDLVAHATRGLFESVLIYNHLMKGGGSQFPQRLIDEVAADYFDILKSMLPDESELGDQNPEFVEQYQRLKNQKLKRTPLVKDLAIESGSQAEYRRYYGHFSKYSHPSLFQIAGDYREVFSQQAMTLFASRALEYLKAIVEDTDKIRDIVLEHNAKA
jgi:hypothetical protein